MADYSPQQDPTIPCADAGMSFRKGDVLEIVDQTDALWWQARKLPSSMACAGLIPSTNLLKRSDALRQHCNSTLNFKLDIFVFTVSSVTGSRGSSFGLSLTSLTPACRPVSPLRFSLTLKLLN